MSDDYFTNSIGYFKVLMRCFEEATKTNGSIDRYYEIADKRIRLRFANSALIPLITPAFEHLATNEHNNTDLTICLWDGASTNVKAQLPSWYVKNPKVENEHWRYLDKQIKIVIQELGFSGMSLNVLNQEQNLAVFWIDDTRNISYQGIGEPLRTILHLWMSSQGLQLVHAGAVGTEEGGVLIVGKKGRGKSTTALSCLFSELLYAGDDYSLVKSDRSPFVYSTYNTAKLNPDNLFRFQVLANSITHHDPDTKKSLIFLNKDYNPKMIKGFPLRAILIPKITGAKDTRIINASSAAGLKALAPSTILQLSGTAGLNQRDFKGMATLVRKIPSYYLELGTDITQIPNVILGLLERG